MGYLRLSLGSTKAESYGAISMSVTAKAPAVESSLGLHVGLATAGILMTPEEFDAIEDYDDFYQYELIHGVLVVTPFATEPERKANDVLGHLLQLYQDTQQGAALDETLFEQYISLPNSRRRADRAIWAGLGRRPNPKADVPSIAIEFLSAGKAAWRRDYLEKRAEYLAIGVSEYWVIDRFQRVMTVFRSEGTEKTPTETRVAEGEVYRTPLLPGFELPLARLLAAADRWQLE
jgi:Uma2 family endonuclease